MYGVGRRVRVYLFNPFPVRTLKSKSSWVSLEEPQHPTKQMYCRSFSQRPTPRGWRPLSGQLCIGGKVTHIWRVPPVPLVKRKGHRTVDGDFQSQQES